MKLEEALPFDDDILNNPCSSSTKIAVCRPSDARDNDKGFVVRKRIKSCHTDAVATPPRTPSPRNQVQIETEATPGNISQLGFDVALSPKVIQGASRSSDSLYTQAFEAALDTVLLEEHFLFSEEELNIFESYRCLPFEARFLYVRLFLRKKAAWFRVDKIGYESDISDVFGACRQLWATETKLAEDEAVLDGLPALLPLLSLDEMKILGRDFQCQGSTKEKMIQSLLKLSRLQTGLQKSGSLGLNIDNEGRPEKKDSLILSRVSQILGKLIRLHPAAVDVFNRLHIVFYRSSEYNEKSLTTLILARISRRNFPHYLVDRKANIFSTRNSLLDYEASLKLKLEVDTIMELNTNQTKAGLDRVVQIFELVFEPWQALVMEEQDNEVLEEQADQSSSQEHRKSIRRVRYYARRFTAGWVWTRLIFKAAAVFARRHEYPREHQIWETLLAQKVFRIGRRGEWYDRKALLEQHYHPTMVGEMNESRKRQSKRLALETCVSGLRDVDTHQIYHNALQRRIIRLESDLKFTKREKHDFSHISIRKANKRTISGTRLDDRLTGKHSIWVGREMDSQVSVEQLCLETYQLEGWKGFHSENSIITTLFAMLFWDVLFMPIPGVFQTEFQTAPLDLATDAFYPARVSEINHRLALIQNGGFTDLLKRVDEEHRLAETWCVGLKWSYALEDLLEISHCLGGSSLAQICKLFAEEYGHRVGGIGDLCLWNPDTLQCMFVEVKGPGDRLSETQIAWLEQMSLAGISVEVCHVIEERTGATTDIPHFKKEPSFKSEVASLSFSRETTLEY